MSYFAQYDLKGNIIGFYHKDIHAVIPESTVKITDEMWRDCLNNPGKWVIKNGVIIRAPDLTKEQQLEKARKIKLHEIDRRYSIILRGSIKINEYEYIFNDFLIQTALLALHFKMPIFNIWCVDNTGKQVLVAHDGEKLSDIMTIYMHEVEDLKIKLNRLMQQIDTAKSLAELDTITW